jgi:DNA repair protein RecN (Recombination protein N)
VSSILPALGLPDGAFEVVLEPLPEIGSSGAERVEFRIALNRGFDSRPLARVASGGELSRIMLALKTVLAGVDQVPTMVFDEIDAGIGGSVATQVAQKLQHVSRRHQVFVVTHLAQLASRASVHLLVEKTDASGIAETQVTELDGEARVVEIARMLGGDPESATSREHARELLRV